MDATIEKHTQNYKLDRISAVDRSILRLAVYELMFRDDIPNVVSINEAIEVAKRFGTEESGRFVNGILDNLNRALRAEPDRSTRATPSAADAEPGA